MSKKCKHNWKYYKVVKNKPDFVNNVTRFCVRCGLREFVRQLHSWECEKEEILEI